MTIKSEPITFSWLVNMILVPLCGVCLYGIFISQKEDRKDIQEVKTDIAVMQLQDEVTSRTMMQMSSDIRDIRNQFTRQQPPK